MQNTNNNKYLIVNSIFGIVLAVAAILLITFRQRIVDQISFWQYEPTDAVTSIADRSGMNDEGIFYFYASQPILESTQNFNDACMTAENTMSVLGCYTRNRIYVYDIQDDKLDGIREVTAVHEALHAIYQRLTVQEKSRLEEMLQVEYEKLIKDSGYAERLEYYERAEPGERYNELFSVVGTEISDISNDLEEFYGRYFDDRQDTVALYKKYSQVFIELKQRSDTLSVQLESMYASINTATEKHNDAVVALNKEVTLFNAKAEEGLFATHAEFVSERNALEVKIDKINKEADDINDDISTYNGLLKEYNQINIETKKLYNSIDSTLAPAPSI